jgi:hypothetical protein
MGELEEEIDIHYIPDSSYEFELGVIVAIVRTPGTLTKTSHRRTLSSREW